MTAKKRNSVRRDSNLDLLFERQVVEVIEPQRRDQRIDVLLQKYHKTRKNRVIVFVLYKKEASRVEAQLGNKGWKVRAVLVQGFSLHYCAVRMSYASHIIRCESWAGVCEVVQCAASLCSLLSWLNVVSYALMGPLSRILGSNFLHVQMLDWKVLSCLDVEQMPSKVSSVCMPLMGRLWLAWYDELKLLKGNHVCRSNTHPDMKSHVIERLATDHHS